MNKFSKFNDTEAVIEKAEKVLQDINNKYQQFLNRQITDDLLVDIKDYLGNLKSALDYLGNKIEGLDSYFPVANSPRDFNNKMIKVNSKIKSVLEKWQPYNNNEWLRWFNILNNKNKHVTIIPQKRRETREFSIKKKNGGGGMVVRNCFFRGKVNFGVGGISVPIDEQTQFPADVEGVDIDRRIWVDFNFDNNLFKDLPSNISVLPFLKICFENIKKIISEVETTI